MISSLTFAESTIYTALARCLLPLLFALEKVREKSWTAGCDCHFLLVESRIHVFEAGEGRS
jgi:hypothetical protein